MDPKLKQELQALVQRLATRPTTMIGTRELREKMAAYLQGAQVSNVVVLDHGKPRAAVLDYETYDALMHLARLVTFEVADDTVADLSDDEMQALEAKRQKRRTRRRQLV